MLLVSCIDGINYVIVACSLVTLAGSLVAAFKSFMQELGNVDRDMTWAIKANSSDDLLLGVSTLTFILL